MVAGKPDTKVVFTAGVNPGLPVMADTALPTSDLIPVEVNAAGGGVPEAAPVIALFVIAPTLASKPFFDALSKTRNKAPPATTDAGSAPAAPEASA